MTTSCVPISSHSFEMGPSRSSSGCVSGPNLGFVAVRQDRVFHNPFLLLVEGRAL